MILKLLNTNSYALVGINIIANIFMGIESKKQVIFGILLGSTFLSNFNIGHVIINSLLLYFVFGLFNYWVDTYTVQDFLKILLDYIQFQIKMGYIKLNDMKTDNTRKLIFDILNTNKYPSVSQLGQQIVRHEKISSRELEIESSIADSVSIDDPVFDQPDDVFFKEISINNDSAYYVRSSHSQIDVIDNYI
jgi:hypothetical protein